MLNCTQDGGCIDERNRARYEGVHMATLLPKQARLLLQTCPLRSLNQLSFVFSRNKLNSTRVLPKKMNEIKHCFDLYTFFMFNTKDC